MLMDALAAFYQTKTRCTRLILVRMKRNTPFGMVKLDGNGAADPDIRVLYEKDMFW